MKSRIVIYAIVSSNLEVKALNKKNWDNLLNKNKHIKVVFVDNRKNKKKLNLKNDHKFEILIQHYQKSLIENISVVFNKFKYEYFLRLDPDDSYEEGLINELIRNIDSSSILPMSNYIVNSENYNFNLNINNGQYKRFETLGAGIIVSRQLLDLTLKSCQGLRGQDNFALWIHLLMQNINIKTCKNSYIYNQNQIHGMSRQKTRILKERLEIIRRIFKFNSIIYFFNVIEHDSKKFYLRIENNIFFLKLFNSGVVFPLFRKIKKISFKKITILNSMNPNHLQNPLEVIAFTLLTNTDILYACDFDRSFYKQSHLKIRNHSINSLSRNVRILSL